MRGIYNSYCLVMCPESVREALELHNIKQNEDNIHFNHSILYTPALHGNYIISLVHRPSTLISACGDRKDSLSTAVSSTAPNLGVLLDTVYTSIR